MKYIRALSAVLMLCLLSGCIVSGSTAYTPPKPHAPIQNSIIVNKPIDDVWSQAVSALSKQVYDIKNMDKDSGLINVTGEGNPYAFVDCGKTHYVVTDWSTRESTILKAYPRQYYEEEIGGVIYKTREIISLDGRINILMEQTKDAKTKVTVNIRYDMLLNIKRRAGNSTSRSAKDVTFTTQTTGCIGKRICQPNGKWERYILKLVTQG